MVPAQGQVGATGEAAWEFFGAFGTWGMFGQRNCCISSQNIQYVMNLFWEISSWFQIDNSVRIWNFLCAVDLFHLKNYENDQLGKKSELNKRILLFMSLL